MTAKRRCAIYTRTSSDEGLAQDFNSLHAQAEACAAYIKSQSGEGWRPSARVYEDGGFSGGSMERPALKALLADIEAKQVDIVVVYKVDRLTRSLADFAKIVEIMDASQASFVSVTQAFNTTTSMGRLTLNVLLSFAQFEREVTGERIRDKFAASKAKGLWMGGNVPLGYDVKDRALVVNETEAETVRLIFRRFLEIGSVHGLMRDLEARCVRSKTFISAKGARRGNVRFSRGALYHLIGNHTYRGLVHHKGKLHQGVHQRIIDEELWEQAQALRARLAKERSEARASKALLVGKVFDDCGNAMSPTSAKKGARTYRYYVSTAHTCGRSDRAGSLARAPMASVDKVVVETVALRLHPEWRADMSERHRVMTALARVELSSTEIRMAIDRHALADPDDATADVDTVLVTHAISLARLRNATMLIHSGQLEPQAPDRHLVRAIALAHVWMKQLDEGRPSSLLELAREQQLCPNYTAKLLQLATLAPDLVERILEGRQPKTMTLAALIAEPLPLEWQAQRQRFASFL